MLTHCCCMCNGKDLYEAAFELAFPLNASCTLVYAYVLQPFRACLLSTSGQIKQPKQIHGRAFFLSFIGNLSSCLLSCNLGGDQLHRQFHRDREAEKQDSLLLFRCLQDRSATESRGKGNIAAPPVRAGKEGEGCLAKDRFGAKSSAIGMTLLHTAHLDTNPEHRDVLKFDQSYGLNKDSKAKGQGFIDVPAYKDRIG
eukprot:1160077-Pelagomonas_calceolata.AAC.1